MNKPNRREFFLSTGLSIIALPILGRAEMVSLDDARREMLQIISEYLEIFEAQTPEGKRLMIEDLGDISTAKNIHGRELSQAAKNYLGEIKKHLETRLAEVTQ